ncbi:unnamed protein product [Ilex paraguariensis]|uniref:Uncharacterized protein n=1 Tax=Ilex paraguariensis TaxID=185542 RepID=A0ABC8UBB5_9AQUA
MAKKKVTNPEKPPQNQEQQEIHQTLTMEDASEKLESLKFLNSMLLKETVERRQQVDSLMQSKGSLESELIRANSEKEVLQSELTRLNETTVQLELERNLVFVFVAMQVTQHAEVVERERDGFCREKVEIKRKMGNLEREMKEVLIEKSEIEKEKIEKEFEIGELKKNLNELEVQLANERDFLSRVCQDKDETRATLDLQIEETNGLRVKLIETEKKEKEILEELKKLNVEYTGVVEEKDDRELQIKSMMRDKDLMERSLEESYRATEEMKTEIEEIFKAKEVVEEERNVEMRKRNELENELSVLKEWVLSLKKEEDRLHANLSESEKRCVEGVENQKQMKIEMNMMVEEKKETEKRCESLIEEKSLVMKDLNEALKQLDEKKKKMDKTVLDKIVIEEAKLGMESDIVGLQKQVAELRGTISSLEELSKDQMEKIKQLECEVIDHRDVIDRVTMERDEARKDFDEEKVNGVNLRAKCLEMEKSTEETKKLAGGMEAENCKLIGEKKELESHCTMLMKEIASVEETLAEARKEFDDMRAKVKLSDLNSELVLNMLRKTVALVSSNDERGVIEDSVLVNGQKAKEETEPHVRELEAIKDAFKGRENKVEDMRRELEFLQNSVAKARKKNGFWALLSSATTIFAAVSVAYVARGH